MHDSIAEVDKDGSIFKYIKIQDMFCDLLIMQRKLLLPIKELPCTQNGKVDCCTSELLASKIIKLMNV